MLALNQLPQAPKGVAGIFNYRGRPVPAVDLCELATGSPARERLSTRIVIVKHGSGNDPGRMLGLIAEKATEMLRTNPQDFVDPGVSFAAAPYLGPVLMDAEGAIQWINEQRLLPQAVCQSLFADSPALTADSDQTNEKNRATVTG